ncbi:MULTISPECIES: ABC transporter ATP-binding protein [Bacillaceae]|uniref:Sulfonate transport system ATP-binding protein n=1 Tax=Peribacillus huizhouensis TaxID=1501239 RepID=A0ABR6CN17_9BACI|nr:MULTISPECIES: ABC transporter ATP-binding protein [Bacillaceae]MBA9026403.1 sulfonate transport system ATP-binding protein [Peribacillus huizhouensis]
MLAIENVSRTFSNGETGFKNISLSIQKGEIIGILGTSGCGKSTLLRVLSGLDVGFKGSVLIDGEAVSSVHEKIGMIFQEPRLLPWLKVIENISFGLTNDLNKHEKASKYLESVGLKGFENHYPKDLSGGMAQRVAIARALVTAPEILLLDEPFSALDAFTKMQLQDLLFSIWKQYESTILLVTHDIDEALYLCDRIVILRGQPGMIYSEIVIDQPKPRARGDAYLGQLKDKIIHLLDLSTSL